MATIRAQECAACWKALFTGCLTCCLFRFRFFALILKLLYIRKKRFFYSDHLVFTLYQYIFSFILLLLMFSTDKLNDWLGWGIFGLIMFALFIWGGIYLYKGMRRFYGDSRRKTILKFLLLNLLGAVSLLILLTIFFLFTAYQL